MTPSWLFILLPSSFILLLALFLYWQLIIAEGAYLGQKIVTLLYDRVAHKYNAIKEFDPDDDRLLLAYPLNQALGPGFEGIVLDVATGTGRLPIALRQFSPFQGKVVGLDHSRQMMAVARQSLPDLPLIVADAMRLPLVSNAIPAVSCLEALEFLPNPKDGLREIIRVLASDGILLTTNRVGWESKLMPGKTWTSEELHAILQEMSLTDIAIFPWLDIYDQVWARKTPVTVQAGEKQNTDCTDRRD